MILWRLLAVNAFDMFRTKFNHNECVDKLFVFVYMRASAMDAPFTSTVVHVFGFCE